MEYLEMQEQSNLEPYRRVSKHYLQSCFLVFIRTQEAPTTSVEQYHQNSKVYEYYMEQNGSLKYNINHTSFSNNKLEICDCIRVGEAHFVAAWTEWFSPFTEVDIQG